MTISKWIMLQETLGDPWALKITGAINDACKRGATTTLGRDTRELGGYIRIKLGIIERLTNNLIPQISTLFKQVSGYKHDNVYTPAHEGYAFAVNHNLKYDLITNIEALILELISCWQITKRFVYHIYKHAGIKFPRKQITYRINKILTAGGHDTFWIERLVSHRDFMSYIEGIYLGIDITNSRKKDWDLLILKKKY
jgi:hypothetical protein